MSMNLNDEQLEDLLLQGFTKELEHIPKRHRWQTPECPPLSRFATAHNNGWTAAERAHQANCRYCQMMLGDESTSSLASDYVTDIAATLRADRAAGAAHVVLALGTDASSGGASGTWSRHVVSEDGKIRGELSLEDGDLVWLSDDGLDFDSSIIARCAWLDAAGNEVAPQQHGRFDRAVCLTPHVMGRRQMAGDRVVVSFMSDLHGPTLAELKWRPPEAL